MPDGLTLNMVATAARFTSRLRSFRLQVEQQGAQAVRDQAISVQRVIVRTSPVDTGRLRASWTPAQERGNPLTWGTSTHLHYAPTLEYGGYRRQGPRTVYVGGGDLGAGFVAGPGIYSTQAPLGFVRKALAQASPQLQQRIRTVLRRTWQGGTQTLNAEGSLSSGGRQRQTTIPNDVLHRLIQSFLPGGAASIIRDTSGQGRLF